MEFSLLSKELNKKNLQAYLIARVYEKLFWPTFFPLKSTPFLTYETLIGSMGSRVAADVVAYDVSAPLKTRRTVSKLSGEIPAIRMKKKMTEMDLNTYNIMKAQAKPEQKALLDLIFGDVDACVDGINARLEWMVFQALSKGKITLSTTTNAAGVITETDIDFQLPLANKRVCSTAVVWSAADKTTTLPITDIIVSVTVAHNLGLKPKYILMNLSKWLEFRQSTEVKDFVIPFALYGGQKKRRAPNLNVVNEALASENLPTIIVIDTRIRFEDVNHSLSSPAVDPWLDSTGADKFVTFLEDLKCGDMLYGPIAEETNPPKQVLQAKKGPILISKWSDVDPVAEYTKGELNAFASWPTIDRVISLDTEVATGSAWDS